MNKKKTITTTLYTKSTTDSQNLRDENRQSNRQEKINMEKRSEGESDIKGKKENE